MLVDDLKEYGIKISLSEFNKTYQQYVSKHQELSRQGAASKFKGGLADHSETVIQYHTATHLLHQALRQVLGEQIQQQGSNITNQRLRFDFSHSQPLSENEIEQLENMVNKTIQQQLPVNFVIMNKQEAIKTKALHFFKQKYPDKVKVYYVGPSLDKAFSKEFCGGPHVQNLSELKPINIYKQESVAKNVRRLYARFV